MKKLLLKLEPLVWVIFGAGIMGGTMLLTGWILIVGLAVPLQIVSPLSHPDALAMGSHLIGRGVLAALIVLPLWKGAHHIRHLFLDFGVHHDTVIAPICYLIASVGSLLGLVAVIRL